MDDYINLKQLNSEIGWRSSIIVKSKNWTPRIVVEEINEVRWLVRHANPILNPICQWTENEWTNFMGHTKSLLFSKDNDLFD